MHTGHADLATATDLHQGGKIETAWTEEMVGRGCLRRGWFERWKGDSEGGQVCLCCLIQEGGDAKSVCRTEFYDQASDTPGLGTLSFTVDRSHRTERHDICQKIHPLPSNPPQSTPHPTQFTDAGKMREGRQRGVLVTLDCPTLTIYPQPASLLPHIFHCP